jgi:hypothetical protein
MAACDVLPWHIFMLSGFTTCYSRSIVVQTVPLNVAFKLMMIHRFVTLTGGYKPRSSGHMNTCTLLIPFHVILVCKAKAAISYQLTFY